MEMKYSIDNITGLLNRIISSLEVIADFGYDDNLWEEYGDNLWILLCLNKDTLVDYLKLEFHAGHKIDPQVDYLRNCLHAAINNGCMDDGLEHLEDFEKLQIKCFEWSAWIDRYYPREQTEQDQDNEQLDDEHCGTLPSELNTEKAKKYFPRAAAAGYMDGHIWKGTQAQLGYLCSKVYDSPRPINALEDYFGFKKLSASITQAEIAPKRSDVKQWRMKMDDSIFFD